MKYHGKERQNLAGRRIVIFVRHGESTKNRVHIFSSALGKYPLTEKGRLQARMTARALKGLPVFDRLYSSPLVRAQETANIISKQIGIKPISIKLLRERYAGRYEGRRFAKGEDEEILAVQIEKNYPDLESWESVVGRMMKFSELAKPATITIAVTHGDPIKAVLGHLMNKNEGQIPNIRRLKILPGTMTIVDFGKKGKGTILALGITKFPNGLL